MWCSQTWGCACFKPVHLWVFLCSKIIHMNGGPTVPDTTCPSFISTKSVYHCCPLRKKRSLCMILYTGNKRDLWKLCWITPQSAVHHFYWPWGRCYLCGLSIIWIWLDTELFKNIWLYSHLDPAALSKGSRWCGEQNSALALREEVPLEYLQVYPWTLASPPLPLVVPDVPSSGQLGTLITLIIAIEAHIQKGMQVSSCVSKSAISYDRPIVPYVPPRHLLCLCSLQKLYTSGPKPSVYIRIIWRALCITRCRIHPSELLLQ